MIAAVEALNYRCLRYVRQEISPFQVLVGPNASGKSTFLDVIALLGDLLEGGVDKAVHERSSDLHALLWMEHGDRFELAVELNIPEQRRRQSRQNGYKRARYEVAIGGNADGELAILAENFLLKPASPRRTGQTQLELFPAPVDPPDNIVLPVSKHTPKGWKKVLTKKPGGTDYFMSETTGWNNPFRLGDQKSALANLPEDEKMFPVATWAKRMLMEGIHRLALNSNAMRRPAPPGGPLEFRSDGSNLPRVVEDFKKRSGGGFDRWIDHLRTALTDLKTVETVERPEDRHRFLSVVYDTGLRAPSWVISDGTLRLLALTLLGYLDGPQRTYLIEEPENGIHPLAIETAFQALSSAYDAQILCATHSPVVLSQAEPGQLLCFAKTTEGATDIRRGDEHPNLRDWKRKADLGTIFASGVLG